MTLVTMLILVAVLGLVALLALAPSIPARNNPFPGRRHRATRRGGAVPRLTEIPQQKGARHHTP